MHRDTTRIIIGKKEIKIYGQGSATSIKIKKLENEPIIRDTDDLNSDEEEVDQRFCGHWAGIEWGLNNYVTSGNTTHLPANVSFMQLRTFRSMNVNLNFFQHSFELYQNNLGIVTGLGIEFNNYYFLHNNSLATGNLNNSPAAVSQPFNQNLSTTKLSCNMLTLPLFIEFHGLEGWRISIGLLCEYKFESHTKIIYTQNNSTVELLNYDNFFMHSFRYGYSCRLGYKNFHLFFTYNPVSLFQRGCGPELFPVSAGIGLCVFGENTLHSEVHFKNNK